MTCFTSWQTNLVAYANTSRKASLLHLQASAERPAPSGRVLGPLDDERHHHDGAGGCREIKRRARSTFRDRRRAGALQRRMLGSQCQHELATAAPLLLIHFVPPRFRPPSIPSRGTYSAPAGPSSTVVKPLLNPGLPFPPSLLAPPGQYHVPSRLVSTLHPT